MHPARRHLVHDHAELARLGGELESALDGDDRPGIQEIWARFESALVSHLEAEERWLFPLFSSEHADELRALRTEHARLRHLASEEGLAADLRTLRRQTATELLAELRAHAAREDETVYAWLEKLPEPGKLEQLLDALVRRAGGIVTG